MDERNSKVKEQIIYEWGSTIELRCVVSNLVGDQPEYIIWKKDDRMLNYDLERGGIRYTDKNCYKKSKNSTTVDLLFLYREDI